MTVLATKTKKNVQIISLPGLLAPVRHEHGGLDEEAAVVAPGEVEVEVLLGVGVPGLQGAQAVGAPVAVLAPARNKMASQIIKFASGHRRFC